MDLEFLPPSLPPSQPPSQPPSLQDCHVVWEKLMEEAKLSREENEVLYEVLSKHKIRTATGGHKKHPQDQMPRNAALFFLLCLLVFCFYRYCSLANMSIIVLACMLFMYGYHTSPPSEQPVIREKFLKVFPEVRVKLAKRITQLRELADRADEIHKTCTTSNMVASYSGLGSSILSFAGVSLAPVSGGLSVGLSGLGLGLEAMATATSVTSGFVEQTNMLSIKAKYKGMKTTGVSPTEVAMGVLAQNSLRFSSLFNKFISFQQVKDHAFATESSSPTPSTWVQRLLGEPAKKMTGWEMIQRCSFSGIHALSDAHNLVDISKHLEQGAETEVAEFLRQRAWMLERVEEVLTQIHKSLLDTPTFPKQPKEQHVGGKCAL